MATTSIRYLGHVLDGETIRADSKNMCRQGKQPTPKCKRGLKLSEIVQLLLKICKGLCLSRPALDGIYGVY